ncbi:uncharacterized protein MYCFIDRAFT_207097 [Pseudocercospora fijiensis CIRAD86]|uniref:Uncharacterized protein n=1 Tax=Pseudocercospora fijiensis (strain CIRAD86) TaxID=383855 RepID=M2ZY86_PSEFD|nr:uncharacterized protein MYCFIDRAFT_207097 [Pseudocercospora fijiensis CIRAD86]EME83914.1 hypothetical protein MYCFIDRAFT_207097 [Pseudocercospora fijiensis CIRAD86]
MQSSPLGLLKPCELCEGRIEYPSLQLLSKLAIPYIGIGIQHLTPVLQGYCCTAGIELLPNITPNITLNITPNMKSYSLLMVLMSPYVLGWVRPSKSRESDTGLDIDRILKRWPGQTQFKLVF